MGKLVALLPVVSVLACLVSGQSTEEPPPSQLFTDERAGYHVNQLAIRGIQLLLRWRSEFQASMAEINDTVNWVETTLNEQYTGDRLPNMTSYAEELLADVNSKLDTAQAIADNLNLTSEGDNLVAFMRSPMGTVNTGGHHDADNRAGGTFTAPQRGLYQVTVRTTTPGTGKNVNVMRNGNETLTSCSISGYYDIRTRIRLVWLNAGDQVFTTGTVPQTFGVMLLRVQTLMPPTA